MSDQIPGVIDDLIFYVHETGNDFSFYLDANANATLIKKLREISGEDKFSFSEKITFKDLVLTSACLRAIDDSFWIRLQNPTNDSACQYLLNRLKTTSAAGDEKAATLFGKLGEPAGLSTKDKAGLLQLFAEALTTSETLSDLAKQEWTSALSLSESEEMLLEPLQGEQKQEWRQRFLLERAFPDFRWNTEIGRGLICLSHSQKYLSVTVRKLKSSCGYGSKAYSDIEDELKSRRDNLFSLVEYGTQIYEQVFQETNSHQHAHGLLVVTGSTNSAKSEIARGLICEYLSEPSKAYQKDPTGKTRRPHLVTFEDPIEQLYVDENRSGYSYLAVELMAKSLGMDYTPRQKGKDVAGLRAALEDALRQTPTVFFVGETRDKKEWELLLDFAATGHLIVTTAHAGSLLEAMHKIFEARKVQTPADRSEIANKLLGVVHLRADKLEIKGQGKTTNVLFPALWRRTARGVSALTSDGLSSLLPHRPGKFKGAEPPPSCVGRRWFIEELINAAKNEKMNQPNNLERAFGNSARDLEERAHRKATEWDLEGV